MATTYYHAPRQDLERAAVAYTPIPGGPPREEQPKSKKLLPLIIFAVFLSLSLILILITKTDGPDEPLSDLNGVTPATPLMDATSRGPGQGVSEKVFRQAASANLSFEWTNVMLTWQRTAFHFQPEKNWMNDPNGPLFYKGWYHLFYQYNPDAAVWGNISWGHAVSRDLIHWLHLPFAMVPDQSYDVNGVWTGSATILPDGRIVMLYTGDTAELVQVQCLSYPANLSDPLLLEWVKDPANPVLFPPPGIGKKDFRDPTTAWLSPNGNGDTWLITIGSKVNKTGVSLVYKTRDFVNYELLEEYLHQVPGTGMWECVDFYPVSTTGQNGLDTSVNGPGVKHVLKASLDDDKNDYYAIGTYDPTRNKWTPDNPDIDVGIGLRYDYGKYYASKTFYDQNKKRRILWGWIRETDAEVIDVMKGWSGVQCIPRTIVFDQKRGNDILQWPVEEVKSLRSDSFEFENVKLEPSSIKPLNVTSASQLDIEATFTIDHKEAAIVNDGDEYNCSTSGGAANRGMLGPFGIVVLADKDLSEMTPVYFYVSKGLSGNLVTHFCVDELRSSKAFEVQKIVYGSDVPVLDGEKFSIRLLVDHSIVESFAQGGRRVVTSRIYPTKAIGIASHIFLFNNATGISVNASLKIWKMESAHIRPLPLNQM